MKVLKYIGWAIFWIVIGVLALVIGAGVAIQTRPVKNKVASLLESEANKYLDAKVKIGRIEGDFFTNIFLKDVFLEQKNDTFAFLPSTKLTYKIIPLLKGKIVVNSAVIDKPFFWAQQWNDSTWNFQKLVLPKEKPDTASSPIDLVMNIKDLKINDGTIRVNTNQKNIPKLVKNFYTNLSMDFNGADKSLIMKDLKFVTIDPEVVLKKMSFSAHMNGGNMELQDLLVKTAQNQIKGNIAFDSTLVSKSILDIQTEPIYLEEFKYFLPENFKFNLHPIITLKSELDTAGMKFSLDAAERAQSFILKGTAQNLAEKFLKKEDVTVVYDVDGEFNKIDLHQWLNDPKMHHVINGRIKAKGQGFDTKTLIANIEGNLNNSIINKQRVDLATFDLTLARQNLKGYLNAAGAFGKVNVRPTIQRVFDKNPKYNIGLKTQRLNLAKLMNDKQYKSNINFNGTINGIGYNPKTMTVRVKGNLINSSMYNYTLGKLNMDLQMARQRLTGFANAAGDFGKISLKPVINNVMSKNPAYSIALQTERLNLAKIMKDKSMQSNLNLKGNVQGVGFDTKTMKLNGDIQLSKSSMKGFEVDKADTKFTFANNNLNIHNLDANTETVALNAKGIYSLNGNSDITFTADVKNGKEIAKFADLKDFETSGGTVSGRLFGKVSKLNADVTMNLDSTRYGDISFGSLKGKAIASLGKEKTIDGDFQISNFKKGTYEFKDVNLTAKSTANGFTDLTLNADGTEIKTNLNASLKMGENTEINLADFLINYKGHEWKIAGAPASIILGKNSYKVNNLKLVSVSNDTVQTIYANGVISRAGVNDFVLKLENVNIRKLVGLMQMNYNVNGFLYYDLKLTGTAVKPILNSSFNVADAAYNDYKFPTFNGKLDYAEEKLSPQANIVPRDSGKLTVDGYVPFMMRLDSMAFRLYKDNPMNVHLLAEQIPLSILKSFQPIDEVKGYLQSDIKLVGTINNPSPEGNIDVKNGAMKWKIYGIDYNTMLADVDFKSDKIVVDTFLIKSKKGYMTAEGEAGFKSQFYKGDFANSQIDVRFNEFHPFNHRLYNLQLTGDGNLKGIRDSLVFNGDVTVLRSMFYIPAIMNLLGRTNAPEVPKPMLIKTLEANNIYPDSVIFTLPKDSAVQPSTAFNMFKNLQGKMKLRIPRNTWIRNEQMRIELMGDVDVYKYRDYFELFGNVDVVRGQYQILGKTFVVRSGNLTFEGGKDINPRLNIEADYNVKSGNQNTGKSLKIYANGTLQEPELKFTYDGETINEGDAVSYILFGTNLDAVASGQSFSNSGDNLNAGALAGTAVASLVSSELTKLLGSNLNVDYIEFKTTGEFDNASFVVGKYLTNKLFMSYERRFGNYKDENLGEYEVRLEYELLKYLFLQMTSSPISNGIDAIVKWNSK